MGNITWSKCIIMNNSQNQSYCKNCGLPQNQWDREPEPEIQEINKTRLKEDRLPFCSYGCMTEKLGLY